MNGQSVLVKLDASQRRHPVAGFPVAVFKRYGEDHGGWLGGIVTYYGFFALAPLLVVIMTLVAAIVDETSASERFIDAVGDVLPFVGADMQESLAPITGSPWAVAVGVGVALWGVVGAMRVAQDTVNRMWGVPRYRRPGFVRAVVRGAMVLGLLFVGLVCTVIIAALTLGLRMQIAATVVTGVGSCAVNTMIALGLFRLLVSRRLTMRELLPGALVVGVGSYVLTLAGGLYIQRIVANASSLYGSFATMIGLFAWIALLVQTLVYGTLVNVVRVERLWPRSLTGPPITAGDDRAARLSSGRAALLAEADDPETTPAR